MSDFMSDFISDFMSDSSDSTEASEHSPEATFKRGFQACLEEQETTGTFTSFATTPQFVNPGLHVEKVGSIGLPLSIRDAAAITAVCRQAPFGRKDQTVVDESVRKTWELDSSEFSLTNPAWDTYLRTLADQAYTTMGVQVATQAHKYKLLLYEEGAFFKAHRDTEKMPGMFGTLVICLPSLHTGGEVVLVH
ncbi:hypothetical protein IQ07DRAFT_172094 [Pyrenochaeta sp. DS3sAY3a]|nr:hypothetical protein IQ07DRAFT_172094 [Pyrenochaeta sp. DS3sAY3a]